MEKLGWAGYKWKSYVGLGAYEKGGDKVTGWPNGPNENVHGIGSPVWCTGYSLAS